MSNVVNFQAYTQSKQAPAAMIAAADQMVGSIIDMAIKGVEAQAKESIESKCRNAYPYLYEGKGYAVAAKNMKIELRRQFPGVKFSVRSSSYAGGNSVRVSYQDGPAPQYVERIVNKYKFGSFDGMDDSYKFEDNVFADMFGGSYYVFVEREYSDAAVSVAIDKVANSWGGEIERVSVEQYRKGDAYNRYPRADLVGNYDYNWQRQIGDQLRKLSF